MVASRSPPVRSRSRCRSPLATWPRTPSPPSLPTRRSGFRSIAPRTGADAIVALPLARRGAAAAGRRLRRQRRLQRQSDLDACRPARPRRSRGRPTEGGDPRRDGRARETAPGYHEQVGALAGRARDRARRRRRRRTRARICNGELADGEAMRFPAPMRSTRSRITSSRATRSSSRHRAQSASKASRHSIEKRARAWSES